MVLLSGIGGAIGAHVMAYILEKTDWTIVGIDSFRHKGSRDRIKALNPDWQRLKIIQHDLVCPISPTMVKEIGEVDYILHLAAMSDVQFSVENPVYVIETNIKSTLTMLEFAKHTPHEAFVYFSTDEVYGAVEKGKAHKEWSPHRPSNAYAASKAASEDICYPYWRSGEVKLIITNTMNNYSSLQSPSKFPAMVQKNLQEGRLTIIHGDEEEIGTRFYIHSRDTADALLFILKTLPPHLHKQGEIDDPDRYHIVGERRVDNLELAELIAKLMGKELYYEMVDFHRDNPAHDIHYGLEDNKLWRKGWKPKISLEDGLAETIEWQQKNPEWL